MATDLKRLAKLAKLDLSEEELAHFAPQIEKVLGYIKDLEEVDFNSKQNSDVIPMVSPIIHLRSDDLESGAVEQDRPVQSDRDAILSCAPITEDGNFVVQTRVVKRV